MTTLTPTIQDRRHLGYELQLAAQPEAVRAARRFTVATLREWDTPQEAIDIAELLVSELATNAVEHTHQYGPWTPGETEPKPPDIPAVIWIRVRETMANLIVEVWDNNPTPPVPQPQHPEAEHGRGLYLIAQLSRQWGYDWPKAGGKIVWVEIEGTRPHFPVVNSNTVIAGCHQPGQADPGFPQPAVIASRSGSDAARNALSSHSGSDV